MSRRSLSLVRRWPGSLDVNGGCANLFDAGVHVSKNLVLGKAEYGPALLLEHLIHSVVPSTVSVDSCTPHLGAASPVVPMVPVHEDCEPEGGEGQVRAPRSFPVVDEEAKAVGMESAAEGDLRLRSVHDSMEAAPDAPR